MKRAGIFLAAVFCVGIISATTRAQVPILYYDFENNTTRTTFENLVEQAVNTGSGALTVTTPGAATIAGVAGAGGFRSNDALAAFGEGISTGASPNWASTVTTDPGTGATAYYQFVVNTTGFSGMSIEFDSRASSTGPCRVGILYSTDGSTFTSSGILQNTGFSAVVNTNVTSWTTNVFDLSGVTAIDNQSSVTIRIYLFAGTAAERTANNSMGGASTAGTFRIDNLAARAKTVTASKTLLDYPLIGLGLKSGTAFTPTYTDFTVNGPSITASLASALTLTGTLALTSGTVTTGANTLTIGCVGFITGQGATNYVIGNLDRTYCSTGGKAFDVGTANGYSPMLVNITAGTFPADFTVKAVQGPQPNFASPQFALQRYWTLTGTGITADLTFNYLDPTDIPVTANENAFVIFKYNGSFTTPGGTVTPATNSATITGVSSFSDWTLAQPNAPSAASSSISGVITRADGQPLGGVSVNLSGNQAARTITNSQGQYRFSNVETDGFYTVTPGLANYSFSPSSRSFSLVGNRTDAGFTATANSTQTENPVNVGDFFVRQQYLDFLGREPDAQGWLFWTEQLSRCGLDTNCVRQKRIDISAAFFMSDEFQQGGNYVYRLYRAALGRRLTYAEFSADRQEVIGGPGLEASRTAFADSFVARPEFVQKYQDISSGEVFVDALLQTVQQDAGLELSSQREALIQTYNSGADMNHSRSAVLRAVAESGAFKDAVYNASFVLTEYFGYLQRSPDAAGYDFWLNVLNESGRNGAPGDYRGMVCSFLTSAEYQRRFSPVVVHSNNECGQ